MLYYLHISYFRQLDGSSGNDTLTDGSGADVFLYESGKGNDVITDYTVNQHKNLIHTQKSANPQKPAFLIFSSKNLLSLPF